MPLSSTESRVVVRALPHFARGVGAGGGHSNGQRFYSESTSFSNSVAFMVWPRSGTAKVDVFFVDKYPGHISEIVTQERCKARRGAAAHARFSSSISSTGDHNSVKTGSWRSAGEFHGDVVAYQISLG